MRFLDVLLQAVVGIPSFMMVVAGLCGVLWVPALVISKAFGLAVQSWGWAVFGIPLMALVCLALIVFGCFGIGLVDRIAKR